MDASVKIFSGMLCLVVWLFTEVSKTANTSRNVGGLLLDYTAKHPRRQST
jgi:hypothetical protein